MAAIPPIHNFSFNFEIFSSLPFFNVLQNYKAVKKVKGYRFINKNSDACINLILFDPRVLEFI